MSTKSILDSLNSKLAIITGYLIFVGFIYQYSFYTQFGINILNYMNTGELLLSFLQLSIPLLLLISAIAFIYLAYNTIALNFGLYTIYARSEVKQIIENKDNGASEKLEGISKTNPKSMEVMGAIPWIFESFKLTIKIGWKNWINILFGAGIVLVSVGLFIFQFLFPGYFVYGLIGSISEVYFNLSVLVILTLLWLILLEYSERLSIPKLSKNDHKLIIFSLFLMGLIYQFNIERSESIYQGEEHSFVEFRINSDTVSTNSQVVFLGSTENYLFLFDRCDSTSFVYKVSEIEQLKIKERD